MTSTEPGVRAPFDTGRGRWLHGVSQCVALGLFGAALEVLAFGLTTKLPLGVSWVPFALVTTLTHVALFGAIGAVVGVPVAFVRPRDPAVPIAQMTGAAAFVGSGVFFWSGARSLFVEGSDLGAVWFAALPAVALSFVYFMVRWLTRRRVAGERNPNGFVAGAITVFVCTLLAALAATIRQPSGDPQPRTNVVLLTVDGLGEGEQGDAFRSFAAEGVGFREAVAPTPYSRPNHASMLVGLHPLRHGVLTDADVLGRAHVSVFETFAGAGYATGAFLSDAPLAAGCGLEQGFGTWDDAFRPAWQRPWLVSALLGPTGWRAGDDTVDAFADWISWRKDRPFAVWIHLADPVHVGQGALAADEAVGRVRRLLEDARVLDRTVVVLAGGHAVSVAEPTTSLADPVVHVPLVVRLPEPLQLSEVSAQIRLVDVANTLLDALRFREMEESEGVGLVAYGTGLRKATLSATLLARDPDGAWFLGVRNNGVKFLVLPDGSERMYDLVADPGESNDISASQAGTSKQARSLLKIEHAALDRLLGDR